MKKNKSSVLKQMVFSYIAMIAVPLITVTVMWLSVISSVNQGIIDRTMTELNFLKNELDQSFIRLRQVSYNVAFGSETSVFENTPTGEMQYSNFLKKQKSLYGDIDLFAVYFRDYDLVVSSGGYCADSKAFYEIYYSEFNVSYEEFYANLLNRKNSSYLFLENEKNNASGLAYVLPLDYDTTKENACVIALISSDKHRLMMKKIEKKLNSTVMIANKDNAHSFVGSMADDIDFRALNSDSGIESMTIHGEKSVLCYVASEITGWKYISIKPSRVFWAKSVFIRVLWIASFLFCVIVGGFMVFFLSGKNYKPIKHIADKLELYAAGKSDNNEFDRIEEAISHLSARYHDLRSYLKSQEESLKNNFLSNFLKNEKKNLNLLFDELDDFDIAFPYSDFIVILAEAKDREKLFGKDGASLDNPERQIYIDLILSNILTELLSEENFVVSANVDNRTAIIVNTKKSEEENRKGIEEALYKLNETVQNEFCIEIIGVVSEQKSGISDVPACYLEAEKTMETVRMTENNTVVLFYTDLQGREESRNFYPIQERRLIHCISRGDEESCAITLKEMLEVYSENVLSPVRIKFSGYEIALVMIRLFEEMKVTEEERNKVYGMLEEIEKQKTLTGMLRILIDMSAHICSLVSSDKELSGESVADKAKKIVHEHYNDVNLSVAFIGEKLSLAPNYLSRIFKEQTGEGLLEYIQKVRIDIAKKFLLHSELTHERIGIETGFANNNSFQRVFKKLEGITPGYYRKLHKSEQ